MKKLFSLLLIIALVAAMATGALAADASTSVVVSDDTPAIGDTIIAQICIINNPGFCTGTLTVGYDSSVLRLIKLENSMFQGVSDITTGRANHASINEVEGDGILTTATFEVIGAGSTSITATIVDVTDYDFAPVAVSNSSTPVTVEADAPAHTCDEGVWSWDDSQHWKVCSDESCAKEIEGTRSSHSLNYVADENGVTETAVCVCGYEHTRDITGGGEEPEPPVITPSPGGTSTESPKTGNGALVAMSIAVLVLAAAAVVIVSSKKKA